MYPEVKMEFGPHDLAIIKRALSIASAKISADVRRAKKAAENQRGNRRPGHIASLAMEGGDYMRMWKQIEQVLNPLPPKEGGK